MPGVRAAQIFTSRTTGSIIRFSLIAIKSIGCLGVKLRRTKLPRPFLLSRKRERGLEPFLPVTAELSSVTQDKSPCFAMEGRFERSVKWKNLFTPIRKRKCRLVSVRVEVGGSGGGKWF